ncbi:LLM class flavin-dependent oxidoreductase [Streptosporangium canum]|uniref:LLM class flavin-dependent oxidoreductase n=1 Tax=Streptosporangium canum TaxID=324952 RepID=UPI0036971A19
MAPLKIGYLLPTRDQAVRGDHDPDQLIDQARRAEALGFDSVWAGDSPVTRPRADPLLLLAAVAVATRRITLGTAVLLPALRHPILLAHQLATFPAGAPARHLGPARRRTADRRHGRRIPQRRPRAAPDPHGRNLNDHVKRREP